MDANKNKSTLHIQPDTSDAKQGISIQPDTSDAKRAIINSQTRHNKTMAGNPNVIIRISCICLVITKAHHLSQKGVARLSSYLFGGAQTLGTRPPGKNMEMQFVISPGAYILCAVFAMAIRWPYDGCTVAVRWPYDGRHVFIYFSQMQKIKYEHT